VKLPRVAIIGNSFIGALTRARADAPEAFGDMQIDFGAAAGINFAKVDVVDDRLINLRTVADTPLVPLSAYAIIFVYATFPYPAEVVSLNDKLVKQGFSAAVVTAAIGDFLCQSDAYRVFSRITAATSAPACILSGNTRSTLGALDVHAVMQGEQLITDCVGAPYLPPPALLIGADGRPDRSLYTGSVNVLGQSAASDREQTKFDMHHLNPRGGRIVLDTIAARARLELGMS
jgi:hypothetical protein